MNIGILHPGMMGVSIAAAVKKDGHQVWWVSAERSPATQARAEAINLLDAGSLNDLCQRCQVIVSVCPPDAALTQAHQVAECIFKGIYVDANAISPATAQNMVIMLEATGSEMVDGGIIGGPAWNPGETVMYLSGERAEEVSDLFKGGPLETKILGTEIGKASALKMCYAAYSKGTTALLCATLATAEALGVRNALFEEWQREQSDLYKTASERVSRVSAKAWRFSGEMDEIADTFASKGIPGGFHLAAAEIYRRMVEYKDTPELPPAEDVLEKIIKLGNPHELTHFTPQAVETGLKEVDHDNPITGS